MATETLQPHPVADARVWARAFAALYEPSLWVGERAGMRRHRHDLVARARGQTLEIGSGTGLNLDVTEPSGAGKNDRFCGAPEPTSALIFSSSLST